MIVRLVSDSVWKPVLTQYPGRVTSAILWALQDLHIGITPRLAAQLAATVGRHNGGSGRVWRAVFENLVAALDLHSAPGRFGLFPGANRIYSTLKVAGPLVRRACAAAGRTYLLFQGSVDVSVSTDDYQRYDLELEEQLVTAAREITKDALGKEHASVLSTLSRESPGNVAARTLLPDIDRTAAALMWDPAPRLPASRWQPRQSPLAGFSPRNRRSPGPNQGAVEGLVQTTREADLGSILQTEFLNPKPLLADRLTQTGYFIYERRPHREKLRDALVVAVLPPQVSQLPSGSFVRACWFDCIANLGVLLSNYKLLRSEFRWIEGDAFQRVRECSLFLDDAASAGPHLAMNDRVRRWYLAALRWLPQYLDERGPFRPLPAEAFDQPERWAVTAWTVQKDHPHWSQGDGEQNEACGAGLPAPRFSFAHIMLFLPASYRQAGGEAGLLGRLQGDLKLGGSLRHSVSVTYVPSSVAGNGWQFCPRNAPPVQPRNQSGTPRELAGKLERLWLDELIREVWHE